MGKFFNKREQEKLVQERRERAQKFISEFQELTKKHGLTFQAGIGQDTQDGMVTALKGVLQVVDYKPEPKIKPWSEALTENLEKRSTCKHKLDKHNIACKLCDLETKDWGDNDYGVKDEYEKEMIKKIDIAKELEAKEAEKKEAQK